MAKRQMPFAGFYLLDFNYQNGLGTQYFSRNIIYTTGVCGGGGHKYWRTDDKNKLPPKNLDDWNVLTWTCVPGKKTIKDYQYFGDMEELINYLKSI